MTIAVEQECLVKVQQYWTGRGYDVGARIGTVTKNGLTAFVLRSDLRNGLPRNLRPEVKLDVAVPARRAPLQTGEVNG